MTKNIIDDEYAVRSGLQIFDSRRNAHAEKDRRVATSVLDPVQEKFYEDLLSAATARKAEGKKPTPMFRCVIIRPNKDGAPEKREIEFAVLDPDNVNMIENLMDKMEAPRGRGRKPGDGGGDGGAAPAEGATTTTTTEATEPKAVVAEEPKTEPKAPVVAEELKVEETKAKVAKAADATKEPVAKAEAKVAEVKQVKAEEAVDEAKLVGAMFNGDDDEA